MNLKEIRKLIELSGGKLIMVDDNSDSTVIAMSLEEYLKDISKNKKGSNSIELLKKNREKENQRNINKLTKQELLDRINDSIAELKERKIEKQMDEFELELDKDNIKYEII